MKKCQIYETYSAISEMQRSDHNGRMTLSGVFGCCGVRNNNHRVYEKSNYGKMIANLQERIAREGGVAGTLEHEDTMYVSLENISHKVTRVDIDENGTVTGTIELLDTPKGKIAQAIVEGGLPLYISSRAMGQIDKNGNVTLEQLSTYDVVSAGGFSQAKLHLNESQIVENLGDNCWAIVEKTEKPQEEENNTVMTENTNTQVDEQISDLRSELASLREENASLRESIQSDMQDWVVNSVAPSIQEWLETEYQPVVESTLTSNIKESTTKECTDMIIEKVAPAIEKWITNEFAPVVENWVKDEYSPVVQDWIIEHFAPGIQDWIVEEFTPEVDKWIREEYNPHIENTIAESLAQTKDSKMQSIKDTLTMLESMQPTGKPLYSTQTITESTTSEPLYIQSMPEEARVKYNMASTELKESIARRARLYDLSNKSAIQKFWENVTWDEPQNGSANVYEGLDSIADQRERAIRAGFRRSRARRGL